MSFQNLDMTFFFLLCLQYNETSGDLKEDREDKEDKEEDIIQPEDTTVSRLSKVN